MMLLTILMTRRRRIKNKWHFNLGFFELKKACYNPDGSKTFEVWLKGEYLGYCNARRGSYIAKEDIHFLDILNNNKDSKIIGGIFCTRNYKNGFPTKVLSVEIYPLRLEMVTSREIIFEKFIKFRTKLLISG